MSSLGQAVGALIGGTIGFIIGGPTVAWQGAQLGMSIGGYLDPPKGPSVKGPRLTDLSSQSGAYGTSIPRIYGRMATHGNVFWLENNKLKEVVTKTKQKSGGKGGGGSTTSLTTYSYFATFAVGLCEGPIAGIRRIWVGSKLFYDAGSDDLATILQSNRNSVNFTLYTGTNTQVANYRIQAEHGANTPAYRGLAYIVFYDFALKEYGNSMMGVQVKAEVLTSVSNTWTTVPVFTIPPEVHPDFLDNLTYIWASWCNDKVVYTVRDNFTRTYQLKINKYENAILTKSLIISNPFGVQGEACQINQSDRFAFVFWIGYSDTIKLIEADGSISTFKVWYNSADGYTDRLSAGVVDDYLYILGSWDKFYLYKEGVLLTQITVPFPVFRAGYSDQYFFITPNTEGTKNTLEFMVINRSDYSTRYFNFPMQPTQIKWYHYPLVYGLKGDHAIIWSWSQLLEYKEGTLTLLSNNSFSNPNQVDQPNYFYMPSDMAYLTLNYSTQNTYDASYKLQNVNTIPLSNIVTSECLKSKTLTSGEEPLQGAYPFDVYQQGYKIKFKPRGGSSVVTVSEEELAAVSSGKDIIKLTESIEMNIQLPKSVSIKYFDIDREYDQNEQIAERINSSSINKLTLEMPLVLNATRATQMAEILLYLYWMEKSEFSFTLPPSYSYLEPTDIITLSTSLGNIEVRLTELNYNNDTVIECKAKKNKSSVYSSIASGELGTSTGVTMDILSSMQAVIMDISCITSSNNSLTYVVAAGGASGWRGGVLYRSKDGGQSWETVQGFNVSNNFGIANNIISGGNSTYIDYSSKLIYSPICYADTLSSITKDQMLNGGNVFAYGINGRWEIIQAATCVLQVDGTYYLSDLLRGRAGTEHNTSNHQIGDYIVELDSSVMLCGIESSNIGSTGIIYRAVSIGTNITEVSDILFTYTGMNLECLAPVYLNGNRHPSTNDWTLTWIRRTRVSGEWRDYIDAPISETSEAYDVEIYTNSGYTILKRTISVTSASATYTSAQQVTDFGSNQNTLYVKVYQKSSYVGAGIPLIGSITR